MKTNTAKQLTNVYDFKQYEKGSGADYVIQAIQAQGVNDVFMVPGKIITPFLKTFSDNKAINCIVPAHESGAGYMADGFARASGKIGVCMAISGPGVMNMVPAVAAAYSDNIPVLAIGGSIDTKLEGMNAFQDASLLGMDEVAVMKPVTSSSLTVKNTSQLNRCVQTTLQSMKSHGAKPAYLQVPMDVQSEQLPLAKSESKFSLHNEVIDVVAMESVCAEILSQKHRFVLLVGREMNKPGASELLVELAERFSIPVATTLQAKGVFPEDHALSLGVFGFGGSQMSAEVLLGADVEAIVALGCEFSQRNTMAWDEDFLNNKTIVQINADVDSLNVGVDADYAIHSDCFSVVKMLQSKTLESKHRLRFSKLERVQWLDNLAKIDRQYDIQNTQPRDGVIHPARVVSQMREVFPRDTIAVVDSGAHRVFAAHYWQAYNACEYLSSTKMAPMGWAIAAGIGAKVAQPEKPVVVITGDGCMLMHGTEMQTAARYNIPVIFTVLNNSAHGGIHMDSVHNDAFDTKLSELQENNWADIAKGFGLASIRVDKDGDIKQAFETALAMNKPVLVEVITDAECKTPIYPFKHAMAKLQQKMKGVAND